MYIMREKQINPGCQAKQEYDCYYEQVQRSVFRLKGITQPFFLFRKYILNYLYMQAYLEDLDLILLRKRRVY